VRLAVYREKSTAGNVPGALELLRRRALAAAEAGEGVAIFPEMFLTGYSIGDAVFKMAEPVDGPSAGKAAAIAREAGVALLYGYPERDGDTVYNSALLIGRDGAPLANYRKTHLYGFSPPATP
jgi:predicted amidohydrolase